MIDEKNLLAVIKNVQKNMRETNKKPVLVDAREIFTLFTEMIEQQTKVDEWIPVEEIENNPPPTDEYLLLSFENDEQVEIGRYEVDEDGAGAFYVGDEDYTYSEHGFFVNAWKPSPKPYRPADEEVKE